MGVTRSRVRRHAVASVAGNRPGDDAMSWPSFTNVGPETFERIDDRVGDGLAGSPSPRGDERQRRSRLEPTMTTATSAARRSSATPNRSIGG